MYADIDECAAYGRTLCVSHQQCVNSIGSYQCISKIICPSGYLPDPSGVRCIGLYNWDDFESFSKVHSFSLQIGTNVLTELIHAKEIKSAWIGAVGMSVNVRRVTRFSHPVTAKILWVFKTLLGLPPSYNLLCRTNVRNILGKFAPAMQSVITPLVPTTACVKRDSNTAWIIELVQTSTNAKRYQASANKIASILGDLTSVLVERDSNSERKEGSKNLNNVGTIPSLFFPGHVETLTNVKRTGRRYATVSASTPMVPTDAIVPKGSNFRVTEGSVKVSIIADISLRTNALIFLSMKNDSV